MDPLLLNILLGATLIVLLIFSALVSGSETSFYSLSPTDMERLTSSNDSASRRVLRLLSRPDHLLSSILIANNLVNIAAILTANELIDNNVIFSGTGTEFAVKTVILTLFLLLFGEMLPKIGANYGAVRFARNVSGFLGFIDYIMTPLSWLLVKMGGVVTKRVVSPGGNFSRDQLQEAIEITKTNSVEDKRMLTGIVRFSSTEVIEISTPRVDMVAIEEETPYNEVLQTVRTSGFSRIPIYKDDLDHITGILYIKDLLPHIDENNNFKWATLLRKPYFVPEHKKINDLLADFQTRKTHLAIIVDEYGGTAGLCSLEDILEEIVGEITDESDTDTQLYTKIDADTYLFKGHTHLGDFLRITNLGQALFDNEKGEADTLAGLMLEVRGEFFKQDDSITIKNTLFTVTQTEGYRITEVKVKLRRDATDAKS